MVQDHVASVPSLSLKALHQIVAGLKARLEALGDDVDSVVKLTNALVESAGARDEDESEDDVQHEIDPIVERPEVAHERRLQPAVAVPPRRSSSARKPTPRASRNNNHAAPVPVVAAKNKGGGGGGEFTLAGARGANARAVYRDGGLLVLKGSEVAATVVPSMPSALKAARDELVTGRVVTRQGKSLKFSKDHFFPSVSTAAAVVMGRNANGWNEWRDAQGRPLARLRK